MMRRKHDVIPLNVLRLLVGTITARVRTEFSIPDSAQCRLWQRCMTNTYQLMNNINETVSETITYGGQVSEI